VAVEKDVQEAVPCFDDLPVKHALFGCGDAQKEAFFSFLLFTTATDIAC
jgi:hypothetical protein